MNGEHSNAPAPVTTDELCGDCPPPDYPTNGTRCVQCPRTRMLPIPIAAAKGIADHYGYDQVVIVARKVGDGGGEHCTTYGRDKANCDVAARIGNFFKHKLMGWPEAT